MCLYPRYIKNKRYANCRPDDERTKYVPIGCGNCIECRRQKANEWRIRLHEEIKVHKHCYFCTLTFANEELQKLLDEKKTEECNGIAGLALRRMLERYRKQNGHSLKHWFVTELGHENTERIHLHGIIFTDEELTNEDLTKYWKYGRTDTGQFCNARTINYIVKYILKVDNDHKTYRSQIFTSAGIGRNYITNQTQIKHLYRPHKTIEYYTLPNGQQVNLPIYYRNHFFSAKQREALWIEKIEQHRRFIRGIEIQHIDTQEGYDKYKKILMQQQKENIELGYGDISNDWKEEIYNITTKMLNSTKK